MKNLLNQMRWREIASAIVLINFLSLQMAPALGVTITSISSQREFKAPTVTTPFALSTPSVAFGAAAPTIITLSTANTVGAITYSSSNPAVAMIDANTGAITLVAVGQTILTASQAAAGNYVMGIYTTNLRVTTGTMTMATQTISPTMNSAMTATPAYMNSGLISPIYTVTPGLPTGLLIAPDTGVISGTPTDTQAATTYTVKATGTGASAGITATATVSIAVSLPAGYIQTATAIGGTPGSGSGAGWILSGSGSLIWSKITTSQANWTTASARCAALGSGWRMATQGEISGLLNTPAAKAAAVSAGWDFRETWTSTLNYSIYYYYVMMQTGNVYSYGDKAYVINVSCVR